MRKYEFEIVEPDDVQPGDRLNAGFGICTVRGIGMGVPDRDHVTWYWEEDQPAVTQHRANSVERVVERRREPRPVDQLDDTDPYNPVDMSREDWQDLYARNPDLLDYDQEP